MSLISGGPSPVAVPAQETLPKTDAREPVTAKPLPKGEAAARYQADREATRRPTPHDTRGQRVDIDA